MNKSTVNVVSIIMVGIGVSSALLIYYETIEPENESDISASSIIGKNDAKKMAFAEGSWDGYTLEDKSVTANLLHVKNDGFTFLVDSESLADTELFMTKFSGIESGQYVWLVTIQDEVQKEWNYLIDAHTGDIIQSPRQSFERMEPINPYKSIEDNTIITQARGDVTVEFPKGITESRSTPFPAKLVVTAGDTLTWKNNDVQPHSIVDTTPNHTDAGRILDSRIIDAGKSFSFTFGQSHIGQIDYACRIHPWEVGSVVVQSTQ